VGIGGLGLALPFPLAQVCSIFTDPKGQTWIIMVTSVQVRDPDSVQEDIPFYRD
jgi:hypothetical protein